MPTPAANWLRDDGGPLWKQSPVIVVTVMMWPEPAAPGVLPLVRWNACSA